MTTLEREKTDERLNALICRANSELDYLARRILIHAIALYVGAMLTIMAVILIVVFLLTHSH